MLALILALCLSSPVLGYSPTRVAVVDLDGDDKGEVTTILQTVARQFDPVDAAQTRAAVHGAGYTGSLNLNRDEARALGGSLGCDYYMLGRVLNTRRLGPANEAYFETLAGIFLIETRNGRLVLFDLARARSESEVGARTGLADVVKQRVSQYTQAIRTAVEQRAQEAQSPEAPPGEPIEIIDGEVSARGLTPPIFYQRAKPAYTEEAALADVTATVELTAVFGVDGRVGSIEIARWAGYGLDETAIATARGLRFRPAERDGRAVSVRALVRYTFRRPLTGAEREAEAERMRRSLRRIQKPR
jgi:TonB family protein